MASEESHRLAIPADIVHRKFDAARWNQPALLGRLTSCTNLIKPLARRAKLYFIPAELPSRFQDIRILIEVWLRRDGFILEKMPAHPARNSPVERVLAPKFKE
jgi:hypothetical protein